MPLDGQKLVKAYVYCHLKSCRLKKSVSKILVILSYLESIFQDRPHHWPNQCLVYKFKKLKGKNVFSFQFRKIITRYRRIGSHRL